VRRVLFDEDVPRPLRHDLPGFDIQTAVEAGWSGVKNGEVLRRADPLFDVFLTADRNLPFQQNLTGLRRMGLVVLAIGSTKLKDLQPFATEIAAALDAVEPGALLRISRKD
jgi:hypothetical protein